MRASLNIIVPNCLSVDNAIIFFISHSARALMPAISVVIQAENSKINSRGNICFKAGKNRIKMKTPAVTSVEEWTKAETGVGAAIAAGSHLINGYWALLVMAAIINIVAIKVWEGEDQGERGSQWVLMDHAIVKRINTSPKRLVIAVINAAPCDFGVW